MKLFSIKPQVHKFITFKSFADEFNVGKGDLIITNEFIYEPYMKLLNLECGYIFQERYGNGEPSDTMINQILGTMEDKKYKRVIAVGGGTVIDIAKILSLKGIKTALDAFEKRVPIERDKELVIVPTTCGTGSEVTNLSIAEIKEKHTKMGLAANELYADSAVLIPELLNSLPYKFFVYSSIDALIHAIESYVCPKSNSYTEIFSAAAINMIIKGYRQLIEKGPEFRFDIMEDFLIASNYAGIAFSNTGVGAVHAMSYPLGGNYHVPHGEANYQFFTEVLKNYNAINPSGKISKVNEMLAKLLGVENDCNIYGAVEEMLNKIIQKKRLREYGMKEEEIELFADNTIATQQRLLVNNYVPFSREQIANIYRSLY